MIGLTILRSRRRYLLLFWQSAIVPARQVSHASDQDATQKLQDITVLLRVKGAAAPATTALFRTQLNFALFPDQEWHWAIVRAKGESAAAPLAETTRHFVPATGLPVL